MEEVKAHEYDDEQLLDISTNFNDVNAKGDILDNQQLEDKDKQSSESVDELSKSVTIDDEKE